MVKPQERSEIDMRVAQELKNNRDFIYQTNQSIQNLTVTLVNLKIDLLDHRAQMDRASTSDHIALELLDKRLQDKHSRLLARMDTYGDLVEACVLNVDDYIASNNESHVSNKTYNANIKNVTDSIELLKIELTRTRSLISSECNRVSNECKSCMCSLKQEILDKPSEVQPMQQLLDTRMSEFNGNFSGVMDELANMKHDMFLMQKHIEELFNKFKRMK